MSIGAARARLAFLRGLRPRWAVEWARLKGYLCGDALTARGERWLAPREQRQPPKLPRKNRKAVARKRLVRTDEPLENSTAKPGASFPEPPLIVCPDLAAPPTDWKALRAENARRNGLNVAR